MGSITLCDCATAAPIVLDNLRRFEERRPLTRSIRRAAMKGANDVATV
jgi:hypothetical protein